MARMADRLSNAPTEPGEPVAARGAAALAPGVVVDGTYEVTRLIGRGGMGAVWEAKHLRLPGKLVVLKVLVGGATDPQVLARFRREAEIGSRLGHPNIVQVLDFNTLPDGSPCLVMELLRGETLTARLARGRLSTAEVIDILKQLGSALSAAHREGIVHRDLKPDNTFLCPTDLSGETRDVVKVLDFGISKMRGSTTLTQDSALMGTPQYMSPEQAMGQNSLVDARTDIFALGAITYEMLAGQPAFAGDSIASVVHAVVYAPSPPVRKLAPEVPAALAAAVDRALAKNPDDRFPDVAAFIKALTAVEPQAGAPSSGGTQLLVPAGPATGDLAGERAAPPRSPAGRYAVGGLVAAALGVALLFATRGPRHPDAAGNGGTTTAPSQPPPVSPAPVPPAPAPDPPATGPAPAAAEHPAPPSVAKPKPHSGVPVRPLAPAARADLDAAEAALGAGNPTEAIRLAQHSLYAEQSGHAYAVIVRARCAQGDLGNAKAAFARVDPGARAGVVRSCHVLGVELR
jgi:serine/threonine-protein kinase